MWNLSHDTLFPKVSDSLATTDWDNNLLETSTRYLIVGISNQAHNQSMPKVADILVKLDCRRTIISAVGTFECTRNDRNALAPCLPSPPGRRSLLAAVSSVVPWPRALIPCCSSPTMRGCCDKNNPKSVNQSRMQSQTCPGVLIRVLGCEWQQ